MNDFDRKCKIFISGPITGVDGYKENFGLAERLLEGVFCKGRIFNPARRLKTGQTNRWYMLRCVTALLKSDYVYVLGGWEQSGGARIEVALARYCGISVLFEESRGGVS